MFVGVSQRLSQFLTRLGRRRFRRFPRRGREGEVCMWNLSILS